MILWKFHFIVIFMYTTIFMIVLFKIPYKYDRIRKSKKEKQVDKKKRDKREKKRKKKSGNSTRKKLHMSLDLQKQMIEYDSTSTD